jgi:hypothetical protein
MTDNGNGQIKRELIGSLELSETFKGGKAIVKLFSTDTRLQFEVLRLFDLSALLAVGIDPNGLKAGQRVHARFWAHYTEPGKLNKDGNPYRDVQYLEPVDQASAGQAPAAVDLGEVLGELRAIRALLGLVVEGMTLFGMDLPAAPPRTTDEALPAPGHTCAVTQAQRRDGAALQAPPEPDPEPEPPAAEEPGPADPDGATLPEAFLGAINAHLETEFFKSTGHLLYAIRQASGNRAWTWADATSPQHWSWAREQALAYMRDPNRK